MKNLTMTVLQYGLVLLLFSSIYGQTEKFDVMTFNLPTGWQVEKTENAYYFTKVDEKQNQACRMMLSRSYESKGSLKANFQYMWDFAIKKQLGLDAPDKLDMNEQGDFTIVQGGANVKVEAMDSIATLININGKNHFVSVVAITNHPDYLDEVFAFLSTVDFNFPDQKDSPKMEGNCSEEKISKLVEKINQTGDKDSDVKSRATNLVQPEYPRTASAVGAKGAVTVKVIVDENGDVISAKAADGHPLLQPAAQKAAKESKFTPMVIEGCKVKFEGVITYNFSK